MNNKKCLVSFDTDRIKDYLFATPDLKKIRGASTLLDVLNRADLEQLKLVNRGIKDTTRIVIRAICPHINADDIITVGGMAMAMVPEHSASDVITAVESLYRRETVTAGITGTSLPITEDDLKQKFGERVAEVSARLRS